MVDELTVVHDGREDRTLEPSSCGAPGVKGYQSIWRVWDGERYIRGRPVQARAAPPRGDALLGMIQSADVVDGVVERVPLQLEHRPLYNNYTLRTILTKWRRLVAGACTRADRALRGAARDN